MPFRKSIKSTGTIEAADQFELLRADEFDALQAVCKRFAIPLVDKTED